MMSRPIVACCGAALLLASPARAQFIPVEDFRGIEVSAEMEIAGGGGPTLHEDFDSDAPSTPFGRYDRSLLASVSAPGGHWAQALGVQDSAVGPALLRATGWIEAQGSLVTPPSPSSVTAAAYSTYRVRFDVTRTTLARMTVSLEAGSPSHDAGTFALARGRLSTVAGGSTSPVFGWQIEGTDASSHATNVYLEPGVYEQEFFAQAWSASSDGNPGQGEASFDGALEWLGEPCSRADIAAPTGLLDLADIAMFIDEYQRGYNPLVDLAPPFGLYDLADISGFAGAFVSGCD